MLPALQTANQFPEPSLQYLNHHTVRDECVAVYVERPPAAVETIPVARILSETLFECDSGRLFALP